MKRSLLLSDEEAIAEDDYEERNLIYEGLLELPEDFFSELRHFQPQIGCLNACKICSKMAKGIEEHWRVRRIRNIIAAVKHRVLMFRKEFPLIAYGRKEHRPGVVFPYLDNDIGEYLYLDSFIQLLHDELGVTTRISTIGYSRYNEYLNKMHQKISTMPLMRGLGGVRLSFTPYGKGWSENKEYSKKDYIDDMANFLKIYRGYYNFSGAGYRKMCVEIRYKPLVVNEYVYITSVYRHMVICTGNYMYVSKDTDIKMQIAEIANSDNHCIELTQEACIFYEIETVEKIDSLYSLKRVVKDALDKSFNRCFECEIYMLKNEEGIYFSVNPKLTCRGNFGINIYPNTSKRKRSGYIITERFLLNAMFRHKNSKGVSSFSKFEKATWADAKSVLDICEEIALDYKKRNKYEKYLYIEKEIKPMIQGYVEALKKGGYQAKDFFDPDFTIDTGIICNLGRAVGEFKDLCQKKDEPLTPVHERNYGKKNSLMTREGEVWRLGCGYDNTVIIEKLDLASTSGWHGQTVYQKIIQLSEGNGKFFSSDLQSRYLIPGQRKMG